jgi:hypothetical protein
MTKTLMGWWGGGHKQKNAITHTGGHGFFGRLPEALCARRESAGRPGEFLVGKGVLCRRRAGRAFTQKDGQQEGRKTRIGWVRRAMSMIEMDL